MKNQSFIKRLGFAVQGIAAAWNSEASFRQQCFATICVVLILLWWQPPMIWWALLLFCCGIVLAAELFNTALESILDRIHPEQHPAIQVAKDCAAAAVLVLSIAAACVFVAFLIGTWRY